MNWTSDICSDLYHQKPSGIEQNETRSDNHQRIIKTLVQTANDLSRQLL